jgi:hypothetical protein
VYSVLPNINEPVFCCTVPGNESIPIAVHEPIT